jgi:hypothetical protein
MRIVVTFALLLAACAGSKSPDAEGVAEDTAPGDRPERGDAGDEDVPTVEDAQDEGVDGAPDLDVTTNDDPAETDTPVEDRPPDRVSVDPDVVADSGDPVTDGVRVDSDVDAPAGCAALPSVGVLELSGRTGDASPTWHRPFRGCTRLSGTADAVPYTLHAFCNDGDTRRFDIAMDGHEEDSELTHTDPFLVIYVGEGLPPDSDRLQCMAINDDSAADGNGAAVSDLLIEADAVITVVATGWGNDRQGTYRIRINPL